MGIQNFDDIKMLILSNIEKGYESLDIFLKSYVEEVSH